MSGEHKAELFFEGRYAEAVHRCVEPEIEDFEGRSSVEIRLDDDRLVFEVSSPDLVALRASVNTWTRLVEVAEDGVSG